MSDQNNTGVTWTSDVDQYFLRDDQAMGIWEHECYSLFRHYPDYGRVVVLAGPIEWAISNAHQHVSNDRVERGLDSGEIGIFSEEG